MYTAILPNGVVASLVSTDPDVRYCVAGLYQDAGWLVEGWTHSKAEAQELVQPILPNVLGFDITPIYRPAEGEYVLVGGNTVGIVTKVTTSYVYADLETTKEERIPIHKVTTIDKPEVFIETWYEVDGSVLDSYDVFWQVANWPGAMPEECIEGGYVTFWASSDRREAFMALLREGLCARYRTLYVPSPTSPGCVPGSVFTIPEPPSDTDSRSRFMGSFSFRD